MPFKPLVPRRGFRALVHSGAKDEAFHLSEVPRPGRDLGDVGELQEMLTEAREEGAAEARAELGAELVQLREAVDSIGPVLEELETLRKTTLNQIGDDIAAVVRLFARRVVHDALAMHPDALPRLVKDAISQLPDREQVTITVSAHASEALSRSLPAELRDRIAVDPEITAGAVVSNRHASLDATLTTAEEGLDAALQEWLSEQWWVEGEGV